MLAGGTQRSPGSSRWMGPHLNPWGHFCHHSDLLQPVSLSEMRQRSGSLGGGSASSIPQCPAHLYKKTFFQSAPVHTAGVRDADKAVLLNPSLAGTLEICSLYCHLKTCKWRDIVCQMGLIPLFPPASQASFSNQFWLKNSWEVLMGGGLVAWQSWEELRGPKCCGPQGPLCLSFLITECRQRIYMVFLLRRSQN